MNNYDNKDFFLQLDACSKRVAEAFGKPDINLWTNRDYLFLSNDIFKKTSVQISPSTLKRTFGKVKTTERYYPQRATRDALAQYAGFKNWEHFTNELSVEENTGGEDTQIEAEHDLDEKAETRTQEKVRLSKFWIILGVAFFVAAAIFIYAKYSDEPDLPVGIKLICKNPEGHTPHTAIFSVQLPAATSLQAPLIVDFGDGNARKTITAGSTISHYYETPGRYYAVLKYGTKILDTAVVYLVTDGWTATASTPKDTTRVYPITNNFINDSGLAVNTHQLQQAGIDTNYTFFVDFVNTQPFNIDADNFELNTRLQTSADRAGVRCSPIYIYVYAEKTSHYFFIHKTGCEAWIEAQFSDWAKDGANDDMHDFAADLSKGANIRLKVDNKKVDIWIDQKKIFDTRYKIPAGKIYGVNIRFAGIGAIQDVSLKSLTNHKSYVLLPSSNTHN